LEITPTHSNAYDIVEIARVKLEAIQQKNDS
jgi:hypothetical protein